MKKFIGESYLVHIKTKDKNEASVAPIALAQRGSGHWGGQSEFLSCMFGSLESKFGFDLNWVLRIRIFHNMRLRIKWRLEIIADCESGWPSTTLALCC